MAKTNLCQSCGMPLKGSTDFGTEKDGRPSEKYCHHCYENGAWIHPDVTFDEFYAFSLKRFQESDMNRIEKFFLNKMYTKKFLKKLERWS
ncbi:zinc ribbon domain-containing protein [Bacillus sp. EAC]|uniref:zinc ribbon domain-containing protein n=1 Tax=Bacillus sp. EAC TaxID=1978338 RepID=UPI000B42D209|nr:zinc ribbon domain-containing protein [Bacillus sp. EAC]